MLKKSLQVASKVAGTFMATTLALAVTAPNAKALDFNFSFTNTIGTTAGTVTGLITGLEDNATEQMADSVIITDFPSALGTLSEGNDATDWFNQFDNRFSVSGGEITGAEFIAFSTAFNQEFSFTTGISTLTVDSTSVRDDVGGINGADFSPATPVPFGVIPDTGLGILGGIWGISRLRKTITARKSLNK